MSTVLRLAALLMIAWGALQFTDVALRALPDFRFTSVVHLAAWPLRWVVLALVLLALEQRLLRWLFPLPQQACPQCGYPTAGRPAGVCPECGLALGRAPEDESGSPPGYPR